jgi:flavin reductase (DIM6/NTAB) family NADH-FMN oxidoreductase RutF
VGPPASSEDWREDFEAIVSDLDSPMFVVTTRTGDRRAGCLVGFATQTSIDPTRMLVALSPPNHTYRVACEARALAVHLLTADQLALAELFGGRTGEEIDKFAHCRWSEGPEGLPILEPIAAGHGRSGPHLGYQAVRHLRAGHAP